MQHGKLWVLEEDQVQNTIPWLQTQLLWDHGTCFFWKLGDKNTLRAALQRALLLMLVQSRGKKEEGLHVQGQFCLDNTDFCIGRVLSKRTQWLTRTRWSSFSLWLSSQKPSTTHPVTKLQALQGCQAERPRSEERFASHKREA